ncbi:MAG: family 1 glycosylhydrolase [Streptococcus sp.]
MGLLVFVFNVGQEYFQMELVSKLKYYDKIFNLLKEMGIVPIVTLYHDDMPIDLALKYNGF